jgi:hypothetical protein
MERQLLGSRSGKLPDSFRPLLLFRAHGCRSDERHRFFEAVVHGRGGKWLGRVDSGRSASVPWTPAMEQKLT